MRMAFAARAAPDLSPRMRGALAGVLLTLLLAPLLSPVPALADLGHAPSNKGTELRTPAQASFRAVANGTPSGSGASTAPASYTTHTRQLETGTVITEYANSAGVVFALTWQGPVLPELNSLLGSYFPTFQSEAARTRSQRNIGAPLNIETGGLVVHSGGRMRSFSGQAYAPALVPADTRIQDVLP